MKEKTVGLDENGVLVFSNDFFEEFEKEETEEVKAEAETEEKPSEPEPEYYTPEQLAEAFEKGEIDGERIKPEARDYYDAISKVQRPRPEPQPQPMPQPMPMPPQQPLNIDIKQLREAAKRIAATHYLGIPEKDFDEFEPSHAQAQQMAMLDIRDRAMEMHRQQTEQAYRQQQAEYAARQRIAEINQAYAEVKASMPDADAVSDYFGEWREGLSLRENREIDEVLRSGGRKEIKALFGRIEKAYRQAKAPPPPATPPTPPPPPVEKGSGTQSKEEPGVVDATEFAKMSPDEQADFLIRNKFV